MDEVEAWRRLTVARVARLATTTPPGTPHIVPITFAALPGGPRRLAFAVDHKPKSTRRLARLANISAQPRVSVLADDYVDDWAHLWWVRADGTAVICDHDEHGVAEALAAKYAQYAATQPAGPFVVVVVDQLTSWAAAS